MGQLYPGYTIVNRFTIVADCILDTTVNKFTIVADCILDTIMNKFTIVADCITDTIVNKFTIVAVFEHVTIFTYIHTHTHTHTHTNTIYEKASSSTVMNEIRDTIVNIRPRLKYLPTLHQTSFNLYFP
jgi:hypothetical protein